MSALAHIDTARAAPMRRTFATWTLEGLSARRDLSAATLQEAIALATPPVMPASLAKNFPAFAILETDPSAREGTAPHHLHIFTVKVRREWRPIGPLGSTAQAGVPYAVPVGSLAMMEFEPRRPFRAGVDSPLNGRQPGEARMIEIGARK